MSRSLASRLLAQPLLRRQVSPSSPCSSFVIRSFSQTTLHRDAGDKPRSKELLENLYGTSQPEPNESNSMSALSQSSIFRTINASGVDTSILSQDKPSKTPLRKNDHEPYHFHIYSHKHNTHITCTKPNREPIISLSAGNLGYRKSRRSLYDSAYSLTKYVLERLIDNGWPMKIKRLEVVLRGFGQGRDAAVKVLMSPEGKVLRDKIVRVADSTRLKFGGTRSKRPRRL